MILAQYIGLQEGAGNVPDLPLFNLLEPLFDSGGRLIHPAGSTVSLNTILKHS